MKITTINDYIDLVLEKFPYVSKSDIKRILSYGWKQFYLANSYGGDVCISNPDFWMYTGNLTRDSLLHYKRYVRKMIVKLRVMYKRKKIKWDGYYYFAYSKELYEKFLKQISKKGRKKKVLDYGTVVAYKILDECKIKESGKNYIFRIPYIVDMGFKMLLKDLKTSLAELIIERESAKFKDILVNNNNYEYL